MRERDHSWDALIEVTNASIPEERGACNRALAQIRETMSEAGLTDEALAAEIVYRAGLYRQVWPEMALTALALAKHWERIPVEHERARERAAQIEFEEEEKRKTRGQNLSYRSDCTICRGNGWVTVMHRRPVQSQWMAEHKIEPSTHPHERGYEEVAPCPACPGGAKAEVVAYGPAGWWKGRQWTYGPEPGWLVLVGAEQ